MKKLFLVAIVGLLLPSPIITEAQSAQGEYLWTTIDRTNIARVVSFSGSGKYLAAGSFGGGTVGGEPVPLIRIFEAGTGTLLTRITNQPAIITLGFEPRPAFAFIGDTGLLCWNRSNKFTFYSLPDGLPAGELTLPLDAYGLSAVFSDSGKLAAFTPRYNGDIHTPGISVWDIQTRQLIRQFTLITGGPVIPPNQKYLAVLQPPLSYNCTSGSSFWSLETFEPIIVPHFSDGTCIGPVGDPAFSPNSRFFLFGSDAWWIYDLKTSSVFSMPFGEGVFTPDSKRIFALSSDLSFVFIPVKPNASPEFAVTGILNSGDDYPPALAFSPTGESIAYAKADGTIAMIKNPFAAVRFDSTTVTPQGIALEWEGGGGHYRLESADHLPSAAWQTLLENTDETAHTVPPSGSARYFRIIGLLP